jgi:hypothetical protein
MIDPYHSPQPCGVPGCSRTVKGATYCAAHAMRAARTGDPGAATIGAYHRGRYPCVAPGCENGGRTRGLCPMHYERLRRAERNAP